jgi:hypothetical protein
LPISFKPKPVSRQESELALPDRVKQWVDEFDRAGLQYGLAQKDEDEIKFEHRVRQRPDTLQVSINKVVRVKNPDTGEEFMYYSAVKSVLDKNDNPKKYDNTTYGIHAIPNTSRIRDENDMVQPAEFSHYGIAYEIPWSELEFDRLVKASNTQIKNCLIAKTSEVWNQHYSGISYHIYDKDDFRNLSWDELNRMAEDGEISGTGKKKKTRSDKGIRKANKQIINRQIVKTPRKRPVEVKAKAL